jgi:hypothetical protein
VKKVRMKNLLERDTIPGLKKVSETNLMQINVLKSILYLWGFGVLGFWGFGVRV